MTVVLVFLFASTTFFVLPTAIYAACASAMRLTDKERLPTFLLIAPLSPLVLGLVLMALYSTPLRPSPAMVVTVMLALMAAALAYGRDQLRPLLTDLKAAAANIRLTWSGIEILLMLLVVLLVLQIASLPLMENDAIEYAAVARRIFESRSLGVYPVLEAAPNGLFAPSSHPPAYHMYLAWGYAWLGVENFAPARLLALFCLAGICALLVLALYRQDRRTKCVAIVMMLSVPLFVSMLVGYHIDALRLVSFMAAAIAVAHVIERPTTRQSVLTGAVLGFAAFAHSIGILAWVFGGLAWLLLGPHDRFRNFRLPLVIGSIAFAVGGWQFAKNLLIYGVPLQDSAPVWELPQLHFGEDLKYRRDLLYMSDRLAFGALRGFVELPLFGVLFWLAALAMLRLWGNGWRLAPTVERVMIVWALSFLSIALMTAVAGSTLVIKNSRYVLTLAPLLVVIAAPMVASWWPDGRWAKRVFAGGLAVLSGWVVLQSVVRTANFGARADLWAKGERAPIYRSNGRFPGAPLYRYIEQNLKPGEKTLVFHQADFTLYGAGPWIDNFDTALEPLYRLSDVAEAHAWLRARNVRFVLVPDYTWPTYYRTVVSKLLADDRYVEAIGGHRGYRLLALRDRAVEPRCVGVPQKAQVFEVWEEKESLLGLVARVSGLPFLAFGNAERLGALTSERMDLGNWQRVATAPSSALLRSGYGRKLRLVSGAGPIDFPPGEAWAHVDKARTPVRVAFNARGQGFVKVDVIEYFQRASMHLARSRRIWSGVVRPEQRSVEFQFVPQVGAESFRIAIGNEGRATMNVEVGKIEVCSRPPDARQRPVAADVVQRWQAAQFQIDCKFRQGGACIPGYNNSYVRENMGNAVGFIGEISRVVTPGYRIRVVPTINVLLESWRLMLEREPDATISRMLLPVQRWLAGTQMFENLEAHRLRLAVAGEGKYSIYVQFEVPDGRTYQRFAGSVFLGPTWSDLGMSLMVPRQAKDFELALVGRAERLWIGGASLERLRGD